MLESGDKGLSLVEYRPELPTIYTISVVPAVPERPLQQLGSCRQHKPQGCGKSTEGGRMLGDHRGTLGLNVASIWLPASSRASTIWLPASSRASTMGVICSKNSHSVAAIRSPKSSVAAPAPEPTLILDCSDCGPPKWTQTSRSVSSVATRKTTCKDIAPTVYANALGRLKIGEGPKVATPIARS